AGEALELAMREKRPVDALAAFKNLPADLVVLDAVAVVAEGHGAGRREGVKIDGFASRAALGRGGDDVDATRAGGLGLLLHPADGVRLVQRGRGVRHAADGGEPAGRRGRAARG